MGLHLKTDRAAQYLKQLSAVVLLAVALAKEFSLAARRLLIGGRQPLLPVDALQEDLIV